MSRQVKVTLAVVAMLVVVVLILVARPPEVVEEVPTIRIGIIGPMMFISGEHHWAGAEMAEEEINAVGGINVGGVMHEIELVKADSNEILSVIDAVSAMERIIMFDEVDFVVGGHRSEAVLAMQEIMADNEVIFLGTGAGHPELNMRLAQDYERFRYWFRVAPLNPLLLGPVLFAQADMVAHAIRQELGIATPRVALLYAKIAVFDPMVAAAKDLLPKLGMEIVGVWRPSAVATDLTAELTAIRDAGAHMIVHGLSGPVGVVYGRQWGELQIPVASVGWNTEAMVGGFWEATGGKGEYETTLNLVARVAITEKTIPFFDRFVERFGKFPTHWSAGTYDAIFILKEAIERAGTLDSDAVVDELYKTDYSGVMGRMVFMGRDTDTPHDLTFGIDKVTGFGTQWRDGRLVAVWPDGRAVMGDPRWEDVRFEGTVDYQLPPWMVEYWKGRQ